jgi:hypothetical protein
VAHGGDAGFPYVSVSFSSAVDLISDIHDYFEHFSNDRYTSHLESFAQHAISFHSRLMSSVRRKAAFCAERS